MADQSKFYKNNDDDVIWWVFNPEKVGEFLFTFDKKQIFNMFQDYPEKLSEEQLAIFNDENPEWKEFFSDRR